MKEWQACLPLVNMNGTVVFHTDYLEIKPSGKEPIRCCCSLKTAINEMIESHTSCFADVSMCMETKPASNPLLEVVVASLIPVGSDQSYAVNYGQFIRLLNGQPLIA